MLLPNLAALRAPHLLTRFVFSFFLKQRAILHISPKRYYNCSYIDNPKKRLTLVVNEKCVKRLIRGYLWVFSNEIKNAEELFLYSPCIVNIKTEFNECIGIGVYNKHSTICSRVLSRDVNETINEDFFEERIRKAFIKRIEIFKNEKFYRVVNAESDYLPGVIIDKYRNVVCVQVNASGLDIVLPALLKGVERVFNPETIILKNDGSIKKLEKLVPKREVYKGVYEGTTELQENGLTFFVDLLNGQKTGWYFDQRDNRSMLIGFAKNKKVLDLFSYVGSFGITLAYYGAEKVTCVDSSFPAICNGIKSASYNNVLDKVTFVHSCVKLFLNVSMNVHLTSSTLLPRLNDLSSSSELSISTGFSISTDLPVLSSSEDEIHSSQTRKSAYGGNCDEADNETQVETPNVQRNKHVNLLTQMNKIHIYDSNQIGNSQKWNIMDDNIEPLLVKNKNVDFFKTKYDFILIDPPPVAKTHCLVAPALKMYEKLLFISFQILQKPGYVFVSSCNRLIGYNELNACIKKSLHWAKCEGVIISEGRVGADHPIHVALPETRYLTSLLLFVS